MNRPDRWIAMTAIAGALTKAGDINEPPISEAIAHIREQIQEIEGLEGENRSLVEDRERLLVALDFALNMVGRSGYDSFPELDRAWETRAAISAKARPNTTQEPPGLPVQVTEAR